MHKKLFALVALVSLLSGCQKFVEGKQMFRELIALREQIAKQFDERAVDIKVMNGTRVTVKFMNSPFNAKSRDEKQQRADAIGSFVVSHYKHPVSAVYVVFASKSGVAGFYVTKSELFTAKTQASSNTSSTR